MRNLRERCQLRGGDQIPELEKEIVLLRQRAQQRAAVEAVVIELRGEGAWAKRVVDEDVDVVPVIVILMIERTADGDDSLFAEIGARVEEPDFGIEQVVLQAAGVTERAVGCRVAHALKCADPVLQMALQDITLGLEPRVTAS